jgi:peroxiredoxin Q/BCP
MVLVAVRPDKAATVPVFTTGSEARIIAKSSTPRDSIKTDPALIYSSLYPAAWNPEQRGKFMSKITVDKAVPDFQLPATGDKTVRLSELKGKNVVLYFYPKDNTPGCTLEGQDFRDLKSKFTRANTVVLGISRDSVKSHEGFKEKQEFNFDLLADEDEKVCKLFDVIKLKNMYGKEVMGVERSTFLIDAQGVLRREWRKVKVDGHAAEVLEAAKTL